MELMRSLGRDSWRLVLPLGVVVLLLGAFLAVVLGRMREPDSTTEERAKAQAKTSSKHLKIGADSIEFGTIVILGGQPRAVAKSLELTNSSGCDLQLSEPYTTCGCVKASLNSKTLAPGAHAMLTATLRPANTFGPLGQTVTIISQRTGQSEEYHTNISVRGEVVPALETSPREVHLGAIQGVVATHSVFVRATLGQYTKEAVKVPRVKSTTTEISMVPLQPGSMRLNNDLRQVEWPYELSVRPQPERGGERQEWIDIEAARETWRLTVTWSVPRDVTAHPEELIVASKETVGSVRKTVILHFRRPPAEVPIIAAPRDGKFIHAKVRSAGKGVYIVVLDFDLPDQQRANWRGRLAVHLVNGGEAVASIPVSVVYQDHLTKTADVSD